jgi:hypothetical protein
MEDVHISQINIGDAILHDGKIRTVCNRTMIESSFMGRTLFGDSYRLGNKPVKRILFKKQ